MTKDCKKLTVRAECEITRSTGKPDLSASRLQDLIRGNDNPTVPRRTDSLAILERVAVGERPKAHTENDYNNADSVIHDKSLPAGRSFNGPQSKARQAGCVVNDRYLIVSAFRDEGGCITDKLARQPPMRLLDINRKKQGQVK